MDWEARLDRLQERHEALTQTVEMIVASQRETAERHDREIAKLTGEMTKLTQLMGQTDQFIHNLARIAQSHERRIEKLEEGNEK